MMTKIVAFEETGGTTRNRKNFDKAKTEEDTPKREDITQDKQEVRKKSKNDIQRTNERT